MASPWTTERLQDRFDDIERRLGEAATDRGEIRRDLRALGETVTTLMRHNRAEQLKYLAYIIDRPRRWSPRWL